MLSIGFRTFRSYQHLLIISLGLFQYCKFKNWFMLSVRISSYGCTWEVWRALKKLELLSAAPQSGQLLRFFRALAQLKA